MQCSKVTILALGIGTILLIASQDNHQSDKPIPLPTTDTVSASVRAARDGLFASFTRSIPSQANESPKLPPPVTTVEATPIPELPVSKVQTILVGQIATITSRPIAGSKGVYTEYHVVVSGETLMNKSASTQSAFDVLELGGFVQMPDGRVLGHHLYGVGRQLEAGSTYLWFLNYRPAADCFTIAKLWEVRNGVVLAVARDDLGRVKLNASSINNQPLQTVLDRTRAAIAALKQQ